MEKKNTLFISFLAIIHHTIDVNKRAADTYLFKYILEHAASYNVQGKRRNSVNSIRATNLSPLLNSCLS